MRLLKHDIERRTGAGSASLMPEEPEDMWHVFNLIQPGDTVRSKTLRTLTIEHDSGSREKSRSLVTLTVRVTKTDFDAGASQLRVSGTIAEENQHVKLGGYHTMELEVNRNFTLQKKDGWDSIALEILQEAIDATKRAALWAVVMQEGLANICLITEHQTIFRQRVEVQVPKKRAGGISDHEKASKRFFAVLLDTLLRQIDLPSATSTTPLLLASPGFTASSFLAYVKEEAIRTNNKTLQAFHPSILTAHSSSGHVHALAEVLKSPAVMNKLQDTKFTRETALLDRFAELMRKDDGRAWYGPKEVEKAVAHDAVGRGGGVLLISNGLFRAQKIAERKRWVTLVDKVKEMGGEVRVCSSLHESGKRLEALGGVAAILTFPLLELDEEEDEEDETVNGHNNANENDDDDQIWEPDDGR